MGRFRAQSIWASDPGGVCPPLPLNLLPQQGAVFGMFWGWLTYPLF